MKIAIVDDSLSVRMMISISLEELGVQEDEVKEFVTAVDALKDFSENYYDLIFCDLHMPEMDGFELIQKISENLEHLKDTKIVMVTGEEDISYKEKFKNHGIHNFIKKPIHPPVFMHHIKPMIEKIRRDSK